MCELGDRVHFSDTVLRRPNQRAASGIRRTHESASNNERRLADSAGAFTGSVNSVESHLISLYAFIFPT